MFGEVNIGEFERGLWFKDGDFQELLGPGTYRFVSKLWDPARDSVVVVNLLDTRFEYPRLDELLNDELLRQSLLIVNVKAGERAIVWKDGQPGWVVGPGRHAFWREPYELTVETISLDEAGPRLRHPRLAAVLASPDANRWLTGIVVGVGERVAVFRDGRFVEVLDGGAGTRRFAFWKGAGELRFKRFRPGVRKRSRPDARKRLAVSRNGKPDVLVPGP